MPGFLQLLEPGIQEARIQPGIQPWIQRYRAGPRIHHGGSAGPLLLLQGKTPSLILKLLLVLLMLLLLLVLLKSFLFLGRGRSLFVVLKQKFSVK